MARASGRAAPSIPAPVTWDAVKDAELDDALRATPAQRLAWLEEAMRIAWEAGARPERREDGDRT